MNTGVGRARIGQWYLRWDKGELFQVTGFDPKSKTIQIQSFGGDLDEIDLKTWAALPLGLAEPPEDWTGPLDDVEVDDLGYSDTEMKPRDWAEPLRQVGMTETALEDWEDAGEAEDADPEGDGVPAELFVEDEPVARERSP